MTMSVPFYPESRKLSFYYADERIEIEVIASTILQHKIVIKVLPDCRVIVSVPDGTQDPAILEAVKKRSRWIYQQLRDFKAQLAYVTPRQYVSGESHYYLGKKYLLKVLHAPDQIQGVKLDRGTLRVSVRRKDPLLVKNLLDSWYRNRGKDVFNRRMQAVMEQALWVSEQPPIRILNMQTQWGSCSPSGRITLNPNLVKANRECIDYVILHELCHIAEHNHSEQFYRLMSQIMPNWERIKHRLDSMVHQLIPQ